MNPSESKKRKRKSNASIMTELIQITSLSIEKWTSCVARASMIRSASCKSVSRKIRLEASETHSSQI